MTAILKDGRNRKDQQHERQTQRDRGNDAKDGKRQQISGSGNYLIAIYTRSGKGTDYTTIRICRQAKAA